MVTPIQTLNRWTHLRIRPVLVELDIVSNERPLEIQSPNHLMPNTCPRFITQRTT